MAQPAASAIEASWHGVNPLAPPPGWLSNPWPSLRHLREVAPVNLTPVGLWRLSRYADCVRLLREVRCGVRRRDGTHPRRAPDDQSPNEFMLLQDPPNHTRLRKLVAKAFTPRAVESWRPRARAIAEARVARALDAGKMDAIAELALPVPSELICELLGVPVADRDRFTQWTADATHGLPGILAPPDKRAAALAASAELGAYMSALIEERRARPGDDLLMTLIRAEEDGERLKPTELIAQSIGLLIAGFETTIGLIGNGLRALIENPGELSKLRARPELLPNAVEECLRCEGPVMLTPRILHEEAAFGGVRIAPDSEIFALIAAANRDPAQFADPDRFDVERPNAKEHIAFGGGTHLCLGAHLARMEAQEAFAALLSRTRALELAEREVAWGASLFRVPARLPLVVVAA
jgi:hypothetical protein